MQIDFLQMIDIDWQSFWWGTDQWNFIFEVMIRTTIMFAVSLVAMRLIGKHGIKQRLFEIVLIITLGSAAGDAMFYKDVGIVPAAMVFVMIVALYKFVHYLVSLSPRFDKLLEGKPTLIISDGKFYYPEYGKMVKANDEFLPELRVKGVSQLGQVKSAILEDSGEISIFFFSDKEVMPGLPIMPWVYDERKKRISSPGIYSCVECGETLELKPGKHKCKTCSKEEWVAASDDKRVQ